MRLEISAALRPASGRTKYRPVGRPTPGSWGRRSRRSSPKSRRQEGEVISICGSKLAVGGRRPQLAIVSGLHMQHAGARAALSSRKNHSPPTRQRAGQAAMGTISPSTASVSLPPVCLFDRRVPAPQHAGGTTNPRDRIGPHSSIRTQSNPGQEDGEEEGRCGQLPLRQRQLHGGRPGQGQ